MTDDKPADEGQGHEATIYDVARVAGVSPSTVSRTFARPGRVSSRTAERVRKIAEEMGYRSERVNSQAAPQHRQTIALATSDITNPYFFPIIRGAESAAEAAGYTLLLTDAQESGSIELETLKRSLPLVDGIVVASSRASDTILRSVAKYAPIVVMNRHVPGLPCVVTDNPRGMRRALEHLATLGHTRICYVAGPEASWVDGVRWRSMREGAMELSLREARVGPYPPTVSGGASAARAVAQRGVTAVIVYNDLMAMGLCRGLRELGVRVPEDISVVSFDNIFASDLVTPTLTTVAAPLRKFGETAVGNLIAIAGGAKPRTDEPHVLPVKLIVRESSGPPGGSSAG